MSVTASIPKQVRELLLKTIGQSKGALVIYQGVVATTPDECKALVLGFCRLESRKRCAARVLRVRNQRRSRVVPRRPSWVRRRLNSHAGKPRLVVGTSSSRSDPPDPGPRHIGGIVRQVLAEIRRSA